MRERLVDLFKKWIVKQRGNCQVLIPLHQLDGFIRQIKRHYLALLPKEDKLPKDAPEDEILEHEVYVHNRVIAEIRRRIEEG